MRITLSIVSLIIILLFSSFALAHDNNKVVVIPLGSSPIINSSSTPPFKVYDANDKFVGYFINKQLNYAGSFSPELLSVVSPKGYFSHIAYFTDSNERYGWDSIGQVYLDSECTGSQYGLLEQRGLFRGTRPGTALLGFSPEEGGIAWYIPIGANPVVSESYFTFTVECVDISDPTQCAMVCTEKTLPTPTNFYKLLPNDSSVTGFQNPYTLPFKMVYQP